MTPIRELQEIHNVEMSNFNTTDFTHTEALEELKSADQAKSLGQCFNSILKVVNRYPNTTDKEIKEGLLKHSQVLRLIKKINRPNTDVRYSDESPVQEVYESTVKQFLNKRHGYLTIN
jgi:hypothetical protein